MTRAGLIGLCLAVVVCLGCRKPPPPRNVLLVTFDTTRADYLGCYGRRTARTPTLDGLAARGVLFEQCRTAAPITMPSHSTMMTGLYPLAHGVRDNGLFRLPESRTTLAEILKARGYATAAATGSFVLDRRFGLSQGFDLYEDRIRRAYENFWGERASPKNTLFFDERPAEQVNAAILPWLRQNRDKPFFVWLHYWDPHQPHIPPAPYSEVFATDLYQGEISYADAALGQVLGELKAGGVADRTVVVMTADHGEGLDEHNENTHSLLCYDTTLHVPLIVAGPGVAAGKRVRERVGTVDILPTVLELRRGAGADRRPGTLPGAAVAGRRGRAAGLLLRDPRPARQPRPGRAAGMVRRPLQVHPRPALRAVRPPGRSRRAPEPHRRGSEDGGHAPGPPRTVHRTDGAAFGRGGRPRRSREPRAPRGARVREQREGHPRGREGRAALGRHGAPGPGGRDRPRERGQDAARAQAVSRGQGHRRACCCGALPTTRSTRAWRRGPRWGWARRRPRSSGWSAWRTSSRASGAGCIPSSIGWRRAGGPSGPSPSWTRPWSSDTDNPLPDALRADILRQMGREDEFVAAPARGPPGRPALPARAPGAGGSTRAAGREGAKPAQELENVLRQDPLNARGHFNYGTLLSELGRWRGGPPALRAGRGTGCKLLPRATRP